MLRFLIVTVLVLASAVPVATGAPTGAKLALVGVQPLAVRGAAFKPGEHVLVHLAQSGEFRSRRTVASDVGTFRVRFATTLGRCERFTIRAFGARGSRATLQSGFQLDCVPES